MRESLKVFMSLLVFVSGLIGMDGVIEIPNSRYNTDGMNPAISLQFAGKAFAIDSELRLHLVVTPQEYIGPELQAPAWMLHSFDSGKTWFQDYSTPSRAIGMT